MINILTEASGGGEGLFGLYFSVTVHHRGRPGRNLKEVGFPFHIPQNVTFNQGTHSQPRKQNRNHKEMLLLTGSIRLMHNLPRDVPPTVAWVFLYQLIIKTAPQSLI